MDTVLADRVLIRENLCFMRWCVWHSQHSAWCWALCCVSLHVWYSFISSCARVSVGPTSTQHAGILEDVSEGVQPTLLIVGYSVFSSFIYLVTAWEGRCSINRKFRVCTDRYYLDICFYLSASIKSTHFHPWMNDYSVQFSRPVMSDSLWPYELQHARPPCPSPTPEFTQTHVHQVSDAIQPSHPLSSPSPPSPNPS